jgi:hypothetical protein
MSLSPVSTLSSASLLSRSALATVKSPSSLLQSASPTSVTAGVVGLNIAMTGLKTVMAGKAYQMEGYSSHDQKLLFVQEAVRQSVSTGLWLGSLMGSMVLTRRMFPGMGVMNTALTSNLLSMVPDTFVRPFLTAKLSKLFLKHNAPETPVDRVNDYSASAKSGLASRTSSTQLVPTAWPPKVIMLGD